MRVMISSGEVSGDLYAAQMVAALNQRLGPGLEWFGMGGNESRRAGVQILVPSDLLPSHGLFELVPRFFRLMQAFRTLARAARDRRPDWALLIDFQDFHLHLAGVLRKLGSAPSV